MTRLLDIAMTLSRLFKSAAFTLVEILAALGILALLAAIALPIASRVREQGRSATCASNLQQIALGLQQYVQDFEGHYPSLGIDGIDQKQWALHLSNYVRSTGVFVCPTRGDVGEIGALSIGPGLNYDYNAQRLNSFNGRRATGRAEVALPLSSQVWLNTDAYYAASPDLPYPGPQACGDWWFSRWYQTLHSGGANYSFLDGHVKWLNPRQLEDIECGLGAPSPRAP